jgi:hypothetical protein
VAGWIEHVESMWRPLVNDPYGYSDGEKIDVLRDGFLHSGNEHEAALRSALDFTKRSRMDYAHTKEHVLETVNWIITEEAKKISAGGLNNMNSLNYFGKQQKVEFTRKCYRCGSNNHLVKDCTVQQQVKRSYTPVNEREPVLTTTSMSKPSSSGYESEGSQRSNYSQRSGGSNRSFGSNRSRSRSRDPPRSRTGGYQRSRSGTGRSSDGGSTVAEDPRVQQGRQRFLQRVRSAPSGGRGRSPGRSGSNLMNSMSNGSGRTVGFRGKSPARLNAMMQPEVANEPSVVGHPGSPAGRKRMRKPRTVGGWYVKKMLKLLKVLDKCSKKEPFSRHRLQALILEMGLSRMKRVGLGKHKCSELMLIGHMRAKLERKLEKCAKLIAEERSGQPGISVSGVSTARPAGYKLANDVDVCVTPLPLCEAAEICVIELPLCVRVASLCDTPASV